MKNRFRKIITSVAVLNFWGVLANCSEGYSEKTDKGQSQVGNLIYAEKSPVGISKETAVLIARARISSEYDLEQLQAVVTDNETSWVIDFQLKPEYKHWTGGTPSVKVSKETGEVMSYYLGK